MNYKFLLSMFILSFSVISSANTIVCEGSDDSGYPIFIKALIHDDPSSSSVEVFRKDVLLLSVQGSEECSSIGLQKYESKTYIHAGRIPNCQDNGGDYLNQSILQMAINSVGDSHFNTQGAIKTPELYMPSVLFLNCR